MKKLITILAATLIASVAFCQVDNNHHYYNKACVFRDTLVVGDTGLLQIKYLKPATGSRYLIVNQKGDVDSINGTGGSIPIDSLMWTHDASGNIIERDTSKNVGIGTVSPVYKLDIVGTTHCSAPVYFGTGGQNVSQGTFDNGTGGNKGISLNCAVGYELNWQGGHLTNNTGGTFVPVQVDSGLSVTGSILTNTQHSNGTVSVIQTGDNLLGFGIKGLSITDSASNYGYYIATLGGNPTAVLGSLLENNIKVNNSNIRMSSNDYISMTAPNNISINTDSTADMSTAYGGLHLRTNAEAGLSMYDDGLTPTSEVGFSMYNNTTNGHHADHFYFDVASGQDVSFCSAWKEFLTGQFVFDTVAKNSMAWYIDSTGFSIGKATAGTKKVTDYGIFVDTLTNVGIGTNTPDANLHVVGATHLQQDDGAGNILEASISTNATSFLNTFATGQKAQIGINTAASTAIAFMQVYDASNNPWSALIDSTHFYVGAGIGDDAKFNVQSSGKVGIGTSTPRYQLDVKGNTIIDSSLFIGFNDTMSVNGFNLLSNLSVQTDALSVVEVHSYSDDGSVLGSPLLYFAKSRGTHLAPTPVLQGDILGGIYSTGYDGSKYSIGSVIEFQSSGIAGVDSLPTDIVFGTTRIDGNTPVEAMRINNAGSVGIGTPTPTATLQVGDSINAATLRYIDGNQAAGKVLTSDANGNASWQAPTGATVASAYLTAQHAPVTVNTYTPTADGSYRVGGSINCNAISAMALTYKLDWTDEDNAAQTYTLKTSINVAGFYSVPPIDIRAKGGTSITESIIIAGVGSTTFAVGGTITFLNN